MLQIPRPTGYPHPIYKASRTSEVICNHLVMYYKDFQSEIPTAAKYIY